MSNLSVCEACEGFAPRAPRAQWRRPGCPSAPARKGTAALCNRATPAFPCSHRMRAALQKVRGWEQQSRQCKQEARSTRASLLLLAAWQLDPELFMLDGEL